MGNQVTESKDLKYLCLYLHTREKFHIMGHFRTIFQQLRGQWTLKYFDRPFDSHDNQLRKKNSRCHRDPFVSASSPTQISYNQNICVK